MFYMTRYGDESTNRATYEYYSDDINDLEKIPKNKINLGSYVVVIQDSGLKVFMANSDKEWIEV